MPKYTSALLALALAFVQGYIVRESSAQPISASHQAVPLETVVDSVRARNASLLALKQVPRILEKRGRDVTLPDPRLSFTYFPEPIFTARGSQQWSVRGEIDIPFPGKIGLRHDRYDLDAAAAKLAAEALEDRLIYEASAAYFKLQRTEDQIRLASDFAVRLRTFEDAAATMYEVGSGSQQAILSAQLERRSLDVTIAGLRADRVAGIEALSGLQNGIVISGAEPAGVVYIPLDSTASEVLVSSALRHRPDVARIDTMLRSKETEIKIAGRDWLPDLGLHVSYFGIGAESIPVTADGKDALAVGGSVRLPIFSGGRNRGVDAARAELSRLRYERTEIEAVVRARVRDLVSRVRREWRQVQLLEQSIVPQAEMTVEVTLAAYTSGSARFLELLDAERRLFGLQNQRAEAIERYSSALAELEWITASKL